MHCKPFFNSSNSFLNWATSEPCGVVSERVRNQSNRCGYGWGG
jgi:hypothetical protein